METLTVQKLEHLGACPDAIAFLERNRLEGFPLSLLDDVTGDNKNYVKWLKDRIASLTHDDDYGSGTDHGVKRVLDHKGYLSYVEDSYGNKEWHTYEPDAKRSLYTDSAGNHALRNYDDRGNVIVERDGEDYVAHYEYDSVGNLIHLSNSNGYEKDFAVEYYDDGQLKRYEELVLPWFEKSAQSTIMPFSEFLAGHRYNGQESELGR